LPAADVPEPIRPRVDGPLSLRDGSDRHRGRDVLRGRGRAEVRVGAILRPRCGIASAHRTFGPPLGNSGQDRTPAPRASPDVVSGGTTFTKLPGHAAWWAATGGRQPQSLFVVFVPLPPVSEMRLPRPWPPVFQSPHDDLHDGHREQDGRREQRQLQHVSHRIGMDRVATSWKTSAQGGRGTTRLRWTGHNSSGLAQVLNPT